jgi:glycosyltransferase 2 family protein
MAVMFRRGVRLFHSLGDQPRARRATDVILLVTSVSALLFVGFVADPEPGFSRAVTAFLTSLPPGLIGTWQVLVDLPLVWAGVVLIAAVLRRRFQIARDMLLAAAAAGVVWFLLARTVNGRWPDMSVLLSSVGAPQQFPVARLGVAAALLVTASPHLVRPARRFNHVSLAAGSIAAIALGAGSALGVAAALLAGGAAAAIVHLMLGSSAGRPGLDDVRYALAAMGVAVAEMGVADRQDAGQFTVAATGADGADLVVKLYGRDAHDSALLNTIWRTIWLRQPGAPVGVGRLRQVEHEALLTLLAAQAGIPTDAVVTAGATNTDDAVLVLRRSSTPIVPVDRTATTAAAPEPVLAGPDADDRLAELWQLVATLHDSGIAHGQLDEDHVHLHDGRLGLIGFRGASVAPTAAQMGTDDAQMLVTTIGLFGREAAVLGLAQQRSTERIEQLLPYVQPTALTPDQRRMAKALDLDLDELRSEIADAAGVEPPPLVKMRRFTVSSVIRIALPAVAVVMLMSALAGFDLAEFVDALQGAAWWLALVGFVVGQLPRVAQAVSTLGAAPVPLPLGPVYALQLAISYVNLAIPTAAARIAVNIRFFQRQGVSPTAAVATGALDGFSGFIVQAILLVTMLVFSPLSLDLELQSPASSAVRLVLILAAVVGVVLLVIALIPTLRRRVVHTARVAVTETVSVVRGLRSPRRAAMLLGGNLVAEVLFALTLGIFVQALGYPLPLHELLLITIAVSLLAGLLPIPGGVGVTEGGLIFGLTSFGVPAEAAFAAVILHRLATFYLPPIWGYFALRWLERRRYL